MTSQDIELISWSNNHCRENPTHEVEESVDLPPQCKTCGEKSPLWDLRESPHAVSYGWECVVDYSTSKTVYVEAYTPEDANKQAFFDVIGPGVQVTDIRIWPQPICSECRSISTTNEHAEGEEDCLGIWIRDESYDI